MLKSLPGASHGSRPPFGPRKGRDNTRKGRDKAASVVAPATQKDSPGDFVPEDPTPVGRRNPLFRDFRPIGCLDRQYARIALPVRPVNFEIEL